MKNRDVLTAVRNIKDNIRVNLDQLDYLLATLIEEEVITSLWKKEIINTEKIQTEFNLGYASASLLIDKLLEKGLIVRKGKSLNYNILKKRKSSYGKK